MTSDNYIQVSTVVQRLRALSTLVLPGTAIPNPMRIIALIDDVLREIRDPPPGDPSTVEALADLFRRARTVIHETGEDVGHLGNSTLPDFWYGGAATQANVVLDATTRSIARTSTVFASAAAVLDDLARDMRDQQNRHAELHRRLRDAWHDVAHVTVELSTPDWAPGDISFSAEFASVDPTAVTDLISTIYNLITGCIDVYTDALSTANRVANRFTDLAGQARASAAVGNGMAADDAVVLGYKMVAGRGFGDGFDDGILTRAQIARASQILNGLSTADRERLDQLIVDAGSDTERAWLLKGLAAGHGVDELAEFAEKIRDEPESTLSSRLSLIDRGGEGTQSRFYVIVWQVDDTACGSLSLIVARAETDPLYALSLTEGDFEENLRAEQARVHNWTNTHRLPGGIPHWPQSLGTLPPDMAAYLNEQSVATGVEYDWRIVDDTNQRDVSADLRDSLAAVDQGFPVPMLVSNSNPALGMHYLLIVGHEGDNVLIYDPEFGTTVSVHEAKLLDGTLSDDLGSFDHVRCVVVPR